MVRRPDKDLIGKVWCDRYQILEFVGRGGMGNVFKAQQLKIDREVALKVIHRKLTTDDKQVKRFEREAQASSKLNHPNNIRVYDYGTGEDGRLFIAMEFLRGQTLADLIAKEAPMSPGRVNHIARQLLKALAEAHQLGLVHRDLKPENIFLCEVYGEKDFVKVLDFGIAKSLTAAKEQADLTQTGFICGTPRYISPEQALGQPVDGRADLYAVAVLMYEMLTGRPPFLGENPISIVMKHVYDDPPPLTGLDRWGKEGQKLKELVDVLLEKNPIRRPDSAEKVLGYLTDELSLKQLVGRAPRPNAAGPPPLPGGGGLPSFDEATRNRGAAPPPPLPAGEQPVEATRMLAPQDFKPFVDTGSQTMEDDPEVAEATQFLTQAPTAAPRRDFQDFVGDDDGDESTRMMSADVLDDYNDQFEHGPEADSRHTGLVRMPTGGRRRLSTDVVSGKKRAAPARPAPRARRGAPTWALVASGVAISVIILSVAALFLTNQKKGAQPVAMDTSAKKATESSKNESSAPDEAAVEPKAVEPDEADDPPPVKEKRAKVAAKVAAPKELAKPELAKPKLAKPEPAPSETAKPTPTTVAAVDKTPPSAFSQGGTPPASDSGKAASPARAVDAKTLTEARPATEKAVDAQQAQPTKASAAPTLAAVGPSGKFLGAELARLQEPALPSVAEAPAKPDPPKKSVGAAKKKRTNAFAPKKRKRKSKRKKKRGGFNVF